MPAAIPFGLTEADHGPILVPNSDTDVWSVDVFVDEIHLELPSTATASVTVTITDKQATPLSILTIRVDPGSPIVEKFSGRRAPGGLKWVASVASAVVGVIKVRK